MRLKFFLITAIILPAVLCAAKPAQLPELTVMSYNIRLGSADDGTNSWQFRCPASMLMIEDRKPDVIGVQEALLPQLLFLDENCRSYDYVGAGREDGKKKGEYAAIIYNKKTVSVVKWGTFWLSETPEEPSKGWDAACIRSSTWAVMKSKASGKKFLFINTHFDHMGENARRESAALMISKIGELNPDGLPVVLVGDFNVEYTHPALSPVTDSMKNARKIAAITDSSATYHGWGKASEVIDHIFYTGFRSCTRFETVTKSYAERKFISDHYPVEAVLVF